MIKRLIVLIICLMPLFQYAQDFSALWKGHFSYNNIKEVVQGNGRVYAAAENAVFSIDLVTNEIKELNTINGLSGETISTIYYSEAYQLLVIGYENGLIEIAFDNDDEILTVIDILEKPTIPAVQKRINHFNPYRNLVYIATNYGISVFNLERLEFGDTYYIGNGGSQIQINQTAVFGDYIYAACSGGNGLKKALVASPNLIDYQNWQTVTTGDFTAIETVEDKLYAVNANSQLFQVVNDVLNPLFQYNTPPLEVKNVLGNLVVTTSNNVFVYNNSFTIVSQVAISPDFSTQYTSATTDANFVYIGTTDFGVLKTPITAPDSFEEIHPDGPLLNNPYSLEFKNQNLWVAYGGHGVFYNWSGGRQISGISNYQNNKWLNIPYDAFSSKISEPHFLSKVAVNPFKENQVFVSSYYSGLIELENKEVSKIHNKTNSTLIPFFEEFYLTDLCEFDANGALWVTNGRVKAPLNKFENNTWKSFDFSSIISSPSSNLGFGDLVIGADGTIWLASYSNGLIGFNENNGSPKIKSVYKEEENMPTEFATALALDNRNQLWIGTFSGLRVLYNTSTFFDDNVEVDEIIIFEDGIAKELLFQQLITDIEVDGSNNKWIGTADSGIFYLSSDGQKTIYHFTKDNSPLPSNTINDVSIDSTNGVIYIATSKGLVSFQSGSSSTFDTLEKAYAYPNPVRPTFNIVDQKVKIKDISENVNIKITDIEGNLVAEAQSRTNQRYNGYNLEIDGGTAYWNGKNLANNVVASGVYLVMLSDLDTYETKVLKLMVVR
ncbi:ABC transporter substrate-binding protein [Mariniflexile gromovii]|uniref:ABC transporter substrate-binding protein n=1 Tax=Mariniflexile gromovii TaxID=362523 RepID=A0ABS4BYC1_9FLAO|nr:ABC transporter substrate-binding protein [Mariniflexile gromovii]MBP0905580.1 ABC transporter substrate-binding protein [Mariniflexile gromovii]